MIGRFEARVREEGLPSAGGSVMDCHALDLPDDSFDVAGSQFGVMLVPDQHRALGEIVRATKPGGRVVLIAYGSPAEFETLQVFISALRVVAPDFPGLPDGPPPLEFQVADPEVFRRRLTDSGPKDVRARFSPGQEMWDRMVYSNPIAGMGAADLDPTEDQQARLRQIVDGMLRERAGRDGRTTLTNRVHIGYRDDVTCFVVDARYRGLGATQVALSAAVEAISRRGGGIVEGHATAIAAGPPPKPERKGPHREGDVPF